MARPKKNKSLPEYMTERKGYYETRRPIHDGERHHFPELTGRRAVKVMPVGKIGASQRPSRADLERHNQNLDEIEARIRAGSGKPVLFDEKAVSGNAYAPEQVIAAITKWERITFRDRRLAYCNGALELVQPFSKQRMEWSQRISKLRERRSAYRDMGSVNLSISEQQAIQQEMLAALKQAGVSLSANSPMASHMGIVATYLSASISLEEKSLRVATGDFGVVSDEDEFDDEEAPYPQIPPQAPDLEWRLSELFEKYQDVGKYQKNLNKKKKFWSFLIRNIGDLLVREISPTQMAAFNKKLRSTPIVKLKDFSEASLDEINSSIEILKKRGVKLSYRSKKTIFDYFCVYKHVFSYAVEQKVRDDNPVTSSMLDKPSKNEVTKKIEAYSADDISKIFTTPLYSGCDRIRYKPKSGEALGRLSGYRNRPGELIERDGRYFMPLLGLLSGARMEEWGGAKSNDVKSCGGIWYLDLTNRSVKTEASKRIVPIHPLLVATDKIDFISYVKSRQKAGDEFLFPEFTSSKTYEEAEVELAGQRGGDDEGLDETDPTIIKRTAVYSRWFGYWRRANGFTSETKNFHSFRHTFKNAIRHTDVKEEIHDQITGHSNNNIGRDYGSDQAAVLRDLPALYDAISKVSFPTLPWKLV